jgi:DNA-binding GntR family transcriptional regulator
MASDTPIFEKMERDPMHERVYRALRTAILTASFKPGHKLTVRAISEAFDVSTMPVRAALTRLAAEKAVVSQANGTVIIPRLTREMFEELVGLRILLEGVAAQRAAGVITPAELDEVETQAGVISGATRDNDAPAYLQGNFRLKFAVFRAARSPALEDLIERVWLQVSPFMSFYIEDVRGQAETDRHHQLLDALRRRDGEAARVAMQSDILGGAEFIRKFGRFADTEEKDESTSFLKKRSKKLLNSGARVAAGADRRE